MPLCSALCVHDDSLYLGGVIRLLEPVPVHVFVSRLPWGNGAAGDWETAAKIAETSGATVHLGEWTSEADHRSAAYSAVQELGFTHALILDSDELIEPALLTHLRRIADNDLADRVYVEWDTYWKSPEHVIRPREPFTPLVMINLAVAKHVHLRHFEGGRSLLLNESYGIVHHLSYAGGDTRIWRKTTTWGHRDEVRPGWWEHIWKGWDGNRLMRNLHPTHPEAYAFAERIPLPEIVGKAGIAGESLSEEIPVSTHRASVVIPVHGGQHDLDLCLASLALCGEMVAEIIVVDNGSPEPATVTEGVILIRNDVNLGFAKASNQGALVCTAETVLFLNSDTIVPKAGLSRLLDSLHSGGTVAAAGPYTNNAGHWQRLDPTYTSVSNLDMFAEEFANRPEPDRDVDMLVGFCLAVKRKALDDVGLFDERFGLGTFEDNDLCYRLRRAGYRLVISSRSFVHHEGSKTMRRMAVDEVEKPLDLQALLEGNHRIYNAKWREDLESGFANQLSGVGPEPIRFDEGRRPERRLEGLRGVAKLADISLCMIVKNEERVIRDCLESAKSFFREVLVLDTGSTDRTIEIAKECGATVREWAWQDSFSTARTESMRDAKGKWIMWIDADDTLPISSGEEIVRAVASAPEDVIAFVVPVRFVEEHGHGTQVDHVKVFRNLPGLEWEGRIHEQILPSLRLEAERAGIADGRIARLNAHVLHSGYDTSEEGQVGKRMRDEKLLLLDLQERPGHPFVLFNLGMTAHYSPANEHEAAVSWLRKSVEAAKDNESHVRKAYALLGSSLRILGRSDESRLALEEGLRKVPADPEIMFILAQLAAERGEHQLAITLYGEVLAADISGAFTSIDPGILGYKTLHNAALAHLALGDYASARDKWTQALELSERIEIAFQLFDFAVQNGDLRTAKLMVGWVKERNLDQESVNRMIDRLAGSD